MTYRTGWGICLEEEEKKQVSQLQTIEPLPIPLSEDENAAGGKGWESQ